MNVRTFINNEPTVQEHKYTVEIEVVDLVKDFVHLRAKGGVDTLRNIGDKPFILEKDGTLRIEIPIKFILNLVDE